MAKKAKVKLARKKPVILPRVMSKLIDIALKDIRKVEKMKSKYAIDMGDWYDPNAQLVCSVGDNSVISRTKICSVCAAGSVMAFSLNAKGNRELTPDSFPKNADQLHAINALRVGSVLSAYQVLFPDEGVSDYTQDSERRKKANQLIELGDDIPEYEPMEPEPFHKALKKLQAKLQKAGY